MDWFLQCSGSCPDNRAIALAIFLQFSPTFLYLLCSIANMYYSKLLFGKDLLSDITLQDLQKYFQDPKAESDKLEFKSFPPFAGGNDVLRERERGILRSISAFLNSEGGILIWGAPKTMKDELTKESRTVGALMPVTQRWEKDAFIAKIANKITPSPKNVLFHRIEIADQFIYLFDIGQSDHAPHQFENVYYMRMDGQTVAAPHHYIEALFKKIRYPEIEAQLIILSYDDGTPQLPIYDVNDPSLQCLVFFSNQTPLINDESLYCKVHTSSGFVLQSGVKWPEHEVTHKRIAEIISYGNRIEFFFTITPSWTSSDKDDKVLTINLTFGGRYSPARFCEYKIDLNNPKVKDDQDRLTVVMENVNCFEVEAAKKIAKKIGDSLG